jgi:hypothetical protein
MDMKEASAMTEASGLVSGGVQPAAGARPGSATQAGRDSDAAMVWADELREVTVKAPLQSLFVAFLLGVWVARRR